MKNDNNIIESESVKIENEEEFVEVEVEVINTENKNNLKNNDDNNMELTTFQTKTTIKIPKKNIKNTIIEKELNNQGGKDFIKISLTVKKDIITIEIMIDCLEYIKDFNHKLNITKQNIINYLYATTICNLLDKRQEILKTLIHDLDENLIIPLFKVAIKINDESLNEYCYYLLKYLINKMFNFTNFIIQDYDFEECIHFHNEYDKNTILGELNNYNPLKKFCFYFEENHLIYNNNNGLIQKVKLDFLIKEKEKYNSKLDKYYKYNNYFNMGKVLRMRSDEDFFTDSDYPHLYQLSLENDKELKLFACRESENSNFLLSADVNDFNKYSVNYIGEIEANFWGTYFNIYNNGYEESIYKYLPKNIFNKKESLGCIQYETNIMGEQPRYFSIDINNGNNEKIHLVNVKPRWSNTQRCYVLNFYGRVKKASAKNFQVINEEEPDEILLQNGKISKNEFNIDFREPFCTVFAFAVSLAGIGKKRVVS